MMLHVEDNRHEASNRKHDKDYDNGSLNDDDRHRRNHEEGIDERQDNRNHKDQQNKSLDMAKTTRRLEVPESLESLVLKAQKTNVKR